MGGCIRALRHAMGHPMIYRMDANDYTLITEREARTLGQIAVLLTLVAQATFVGMWRR